MCGLFATSALFAHVLQAPHLAPIPVDPVSQKILWLKKVFESTSFRSANAQSILPVTYSINLTQVDRIETENEQFSGTASITLSFPITLQDCADYISTANKVTWTPVTFTPPKFEIGNRGVVSRSSGSTDAKVKHGRIRVKVKKVGFFILSSPVGWLLSCTQHMWCGNDVDAQKHCEATLDKGLQARARTCHAYVHDVYCSSHYVSFPILG